MKNCNVCATRLGEPIFASTSQMALTSLCELRKGQVRVWSCAHCGHLLGDELPDTAEYYRTDYRILLDQDDEDQIYEVNGDQIIYRTSHQVSTLLSKLSVPQGALLLDYGCAKASTPKQLLAHRADIRVHLFDVSDMYVAHWDRFVQAERRAIHEIPPDWQKKFDVVTSFFALEHIPEPRETLRTIAGLLNDNGVFYGIVPDTFGNIADFIVIDHVNHFTTSSLQFLLASVGFTEISIDASAHRGALVFSARKLGLPRQTEYVKFDNQRTQALAEYWTRLSEKIRSSEREVATPMAIYGSGFYGAYIFSVLEHPEKVTCFLDRSPYQQGKVLFDKPILAPDQLPAHVGTLIVGLNPAIARETMARMIWPKHQALRLIYLDGEAT